MKAVIFDLNGVFIQSPYLSDRFETEFDIAKEEFLPALKDVLSKARRSKTGNSFVYWKEYLDKWHIDLNEEQFFDFWFKVEEENTAMIELAKELKTKGFKLFILSNNFAERAEHYSKFFDFLETIFDKVYYSWQTGFIKPDKQAYQNVLTENNLLAENCFYFDNSQKNVDAANDLGLKAFLFEGVEATRQIIEDFS